MSNNKVSYKEYWAYKEVLKNWESEVTDTQVTIYFDKSKNDIYAQFKLEYDEDAEIYFIWHEGELLNDKMDFYDTYDEAVQSCFYYFHTRF